MVVEGWWRGMRVEGWRSEEKRMADQVAGEQLLIFIARG